MVIAAILIDPNNPATWLGAGGTASLAAVIFVAFVRGWVIPGHIYEDLLKQNAVKDDRIKHLTDVFESDVIPSLNKSEETNKAAYDLLKDFSVRDKRRSPWR